MTFQQKLEVAIEKNNSLLCVGLDPDPGKFTDAQKNNSDPIFSFNKSIIDQTHEHVCAYKPNSAFYEALGAKGIAELKKTTDYLASNYPDIPVILDAKRADIESTSEAYASYVFDYLHADAVTLHPYLGKEALRPFLRHAEKGCIILCKTSNSGAGEFQDLIVGSQQLYKIVAQNVAKKWNTNNNCLLVVGATYPEELGKIRDIVGNMFVLVPGIGIQGGDLEPTLHNGLTREKSGLIISSSRAIIYAGNPAEEARLLKEKINNFR